MQNVVNKSRIEQLKELLLIIAEEIDSRPGSRDLAALSRQYRETIKEIEEIEGATPDDEIAGILSERESNGESRTVR